MKNRLVVGLVALVVVVFLASAVNAIVSSQNATNFNGTFIWSNMSSTTEQYEKFWGTAGLSGFTNKTAINFSDSGTARNAQFIDSMTSSISDAAVVIANQAGGDFQLTFINATTGLNLSKQTPTGNTANTLNQRGDGIFWNGSEEVFVVYSDAFGSNDFMSINVVNWTGFKVGVQIQYRIPAPSGGAGLYSDFSIKQRPNCKCNESA